MKPITGPHAANHHHTGEIHALPAPEKPDDAAPTAQDFREMKEGGMAFLKFWRWLSPQFRWVLGGAGGTGFVALIITGLSLYGTPERLDKVEARLEVLEERSEYIEDIAEALAEHAGLLLPKKKARPDAK